MSTVTCAKTTPLTLKAETAADLMNPDPISIRADAAIHEAMALLIDHSFSAAPVIDEAGRPVGVVSRSDLLTHDRERIEYVPPVPDYYGEDELAAALKERVGRKGFQVVNVDPTRVSDIMTPIVFSVRPDTPVARVIYDMLALKVHRLFVVDRCGVLVGVISSSDVLRHLE
jgi:CBS-domain-containing membrane protein